MKKIIFAAVILFSVFGFGANVFADYPLTDACLTSFKNASWDAFVAKYRQLNPNAFVCDSNKTVFANPFDWCNADCKYMGYVGGVCEPGVCGGGRIAQTGTDPGTEACDWTTDWYTGVNMPCCCINRPLDEASKPSVPQYKAPAGTSAFGKAWWRTPGGTSPTFPMTRYSNGYTTPATPSCFGENVACTNQCTRGTKTCVDSKTVKNCTYGTDGCTKWVTYQCQESGSSCVDGKCTNVQVCLPSGDYGCKVCSSDGKSLVDTNSKCPSGQVCSNGVCQTAQTAATCTKKTCSELGYSCGTASDGCGANLDCGTCPSGQTCASGTCKTNQFCTSNAVSGCKVCNGQGTAWVDTDSKCTGGKTCSSGVCQTAQACAPVTCASLGFNCGNTGDHCGYTLNCGTCASGQVCADHSCKAAGNANSGNTAKYTRAEIMVMIQRIQQQIAELIKQLAALRAAR